MGVDTLPDPKQASMLPFVLDDLGCNGTESTLLECLPQHNCNLQTDITDESAAVSCSRKGSVYRMQNL